MNGGAPASGFDTSASSGVERLLSLLLVGGVVVMLRLTYTELIVPRYAYMGYTYAAPPSWMELVLVTVALVPALVLPLRLSRPSQYALWFFYFFAFIPAVLVPMYGATLDPLDLLRLALILVACFVVLLAGTRLPCGRWVQLAIPPSLFWLGLLAFVSVALGAVGVVFGVPRSLPSLGQIYERRAEFKEIVGAGNTGVVYLSLWLANVANPLLLARGLFEHRWIWAFLGVAGQIVIFAVSGFKSVLFTPAMLIGLALLLYGTRPVFGLRFPAALFTLVGLGLAVDGLFVFNPIADLIVRRAIVTPGLLTGTYVMYFSNHPAALYGTGIFRGWAENIYGQSPPLVVGQYLSPGQNLSANANFLADAFANLGFAGMLVFALILAAVLWLFDSVSAGKPLKMTIFLIAMPAFALTNSGLLTCLLTHGLGFALLVAALLPKAPDESALRMEGARLD